MNRVAGLIEPIVVMAFGGYLGLVNQAATDTSAWLRVPALLAALILVAQGILGVQQQRSTGIIAEPRHQDIEVDATASEVVSWSPHELETPGKARHRDAPVQVKVTSEDATVGVREKPQTSYIVMALAVWLGLASLANPGAPKSLLVMSLLASFLLFAEAWQMLRQAG